MKSGMRYQLAGALALILAMQAAHASTMTSAPTYTASLIFDASVLVQGDSATVDPLQIPGAGELFLTLTDLDFPSPFAALSLSIADAAGGSLATSAGAGTLTLEVSGPMTLYADVFTTPQGSTDLGLYNISATFVSATPVRLPASGLLLAAIVGPGALLLRAARRRADNCNTRHALMRACS